MRRFGTSVVTARRNAFWRNVDRSLLQRRVWAMTIRETPPAMSEPWTMGDLRCHWGKLVGAQLELTCVPVSISRTGEILLHASTPSWCVELHAMSSYLVAKLPRDVDGITPTSVVCKWRKDVQPNQDAGPPTYYGNDADPLEPWR
jgi:hypothetical protein